MSSIKKLCFLGDGAVGKTAIIAKLVEGKFPKRPRLTIGVNFFTFTFKKKKYQVWDLGGQSHFDFMRGTFLVGSSIVFIVFDLTRPSCGRKRIPYYKNVIEENSNPEIILILYNKSDLVDVGLNIYEEIDETQKILGEVFKKKIKSFIVSAKKGDEIYQPFEYIDNNLK